MTTEYELRVTGGPVEGLDHVFRIGPRSPSSGVHERISFEYEDGGGLTVTVGPYIVEERRAISDTTDRSSSGE